MPTNNSESVHGARVSNIDILIAEIIVTGFWVSGSHVENYNDDAYYDNGERDYSRAKERVDYF